MIVDKINAYLSTQGRTVDDAILAEVATLAQFAFSRQFGIREERAVKQPYFSSIGKCMRQQAYELLGFEANGKEIDSRSKMVFFQGDMAELAIVLLAKQAGCQITACGQAQESVQLDEFLRGRPDGILDGTRLVEVKSMSSYGFDRFERGDIDEGYIFQCNAGMEALKLTETVFVGLNKDAGVLHEQIIKRDPAIVAEIRSRMAILKTATKETLPERPYAPNEKGFYPWQCLYCAHWKTCLPNAERVLVKSSYKLKEKEKVHATA